MKEAEIMTQQEAVAVAALYRRERDDVIERLLVARIYSRIGEEAAVKEAVRTIMERPGYKNGMRKIEEMERTSA